MVEIVLSWPLAVLLALLGAAWIYSDGQKRDMEAADMWAVGFFIGMFIPPIIGAVIVGVAYLWKRKPREGSPQPVEHYR